MPKRGSGKLYELNGEHHADGKRREHDDGNAVHAHGLELVHQVGAVEGAPENGPEGTPRNHREVPGLVQEPENVGAEALEG